MKIQLFSGSVAAMFSEQNLTGNLFRILLTILYSFPEVNLVLKLQFLLCLYLDSINEIVSPSPVSKGVFTLIKICP